MKRYLADTTVLVELLHGNKAAKKFLETYKPYISAVTVAELYQGCKDKNDFRIIDGICSDLSVLLINEKITSVAFKLLNQYFLSHNLLFLDAVIAATVLETKLTLVTGNVKHFRYIDNLQIMSWKEVENTFSTEQHKESQL